MNKFKKITAWVAIAVGVLFFFSAGSDIQLGFGAVLVAMGIFNL